LWGFSPRGGAKNPPTSFCMAAERSASSFNKARLNSDYSN
jgi:hypothetical protein